MNGPTSSSTAVLNGFLEAGATLPERAVDDLVAGSEVLQGRPAKSPRVVRWKPDGEPIVVKFWYRKTRHVYPHSARFMKHAAALGERGVAAPEVVGWGAIAGTHIRFVSYRALPGQSLRSPELKLDLQALAGYLAGLHDRGVDFRGLHLGNILWCPEAGFSLIDVSDCNFSRQPLSRRRRIKRLIRLFSHSDDEAVFRANGNWRTFTLAYCAAAGLDGEASATVLDQVGRALEDGQAG